MVDYSGYEHIKIEKSEGIALVTLNRPPYNLINLRMHTEMRDITLDLKRDEEVRVVVFTNEGRHFASGGDFDLFENFHDPVVNRRLFDEARELIWGMIELDKVAVAAVHGQAAGMGCQLALLCDIVFADERARFVDGHMLIGVPPGDGGSLIWPVLIGLARAKQYLFTSDPLPAQEAERIGLINSVVPSDQLLSTAMEWAKRFADGPTEALRGAKDSLNQWLRIAAVNVFHFSWALQRGAGALPEADEAIAAMREKRKPKYH